jgi:hypothetical protein
MCVAAPLLARRNLSQGKGDRHGRCALPSSFLHAMALWLCRLALEGSTEHLEPSSSRFARPLLRHLTVYLALEPMYGIVAASLIS